MGTDKVWPQIGADFSQMGLGDLVSRCVVYLSGIMTGLGKVRVRFFARLADVAGTRVAELDLGEGLTAGDAYRLLCGKYPAMEGLKGSLMYAVNAEYVSAEQPLQDGDELALIPPVSGGSNAV